MHERDKKCLQKLCEDVDWVNVAQDGVQQCAGVFPASEVELCSVNAVPFKHWSVLVVLQCAEEGSISQWLSACPH
jgi:hypothetical protein